MAGSPPSLLVNVTVSDEGESEIVRELKMPLISRRSSDTGSFGFDVRSLMKSLMERMMGGQPSSLGNHQSDGPAPIDSSMRLRRTSEYIYLSKSLVYLSVSSYGVDRFHNLDNAFSAMSFGHLPRCFDFGKSPFTPVVRLLVLG